MNAKPPVSKIKQLLQERKQPRSKPGMHWKPARLLQRLTTERKLQQWLSLESSLTQKLKERCPELEVQVLSEELDVPLASEAQSLKLAFQEKAWIRCVLLRCQSNNWVYARTVIPNMQPENPWHELHNLGTKPLGEVLFDDKSLHRTPFEFNKVALKNWPYLNQHLALSEHRKPSFARRSTFVKQQTPLLLTEVFLPELLTSDY